MAQLRRTMTTNLGDVSDKDIIEFAKACNEQGVNDSMIIKNCIRYWITTIGMVAPLPAVVSPLGNDNMKEYIHNLVKEAVSNEKPSVNKDAKSKRKYSKKTVSTNPTVTPKEDPKEMPKETLKEVKKDTGDAETEYTHMLEKLKSVKDNTK